MQIHLDGSIIEVKEGTTLATLLPDHDPRCVVAVIKPVEAAAERTPFFRFTTTKGEIVIETTDPRITELESPDAVQKLHIQWVDRYAAAFGPFPSDIQPGRQGFSYERGDVILGCGGYDPSRSFLIFSRMRHLADHGAPIEGGILGRVVSGRGIIDQWVSGDRIETIERVLSWEDRTRSFTTTDLGLALEDGMQIVSYVGAVAQGYSPDKVSTDQAESVEHLLLALRDSRFVVSRATSTHIRDCRMIQSEPPAGKKGPRREGTISIRTDGPSRGCVYLYRADVASQPAHTVAGRITHGIELVKLATDSDILYIRVEPYHCDMLGMSVEEGIQRAKERGIEARFDRTEEGRIIVDQEPPTTLEVLSERKISLSTAPRAKVVEINLDDTRAPSSCMVFREMTGLRFRTIGKLPVFFIFEDVILFRPPMKTTVKLLPENVPTTDVPAYTLAITNDTRKGTGTIGIRLSDNSEFGPTGEVFDATNVIGTVLEPEKLKGVKEKEMIYIREAPQ